MKREGAKGFFFLKVRMPRDPLREISEIGSQFTSLLEFDILTHQATTIEVPQFNSCNVDTSWDLGRIRKTISITHVNRPFSSCTDR